MRFFVSETARELPGFHQIEENLSLAPVPPEKTFVKVGECLDDFPKFIMAYQLSVVEYICFRGSEDRPNKV